MFVNLGCFHLVREVVSQFGGPSKVVGTYGGSMAQEPLLLVSFLMIFLRSKMVILCNFVDKNRQKHVEFLCFFGGGGKSPQCI